VRLTVRVIPRSRRNAMEWEQGVLKAWLTAPPVDGAANDALIALLAERLGLSKHSISIVRGATARQKILEITGMTLEDLEQRIKRQQS
jgi:uncharacterized protein